MAKNSISIEEYQKIKSLRQTHMRIRMGCTSIIFIAVIVFVYNFFSQFQSFPLEETQSAIVQEIMPLAPQMNQQFIGIYQKNHEEIQKKLMGVLDKHQPAIKASLEKEMASFIQEFPDQAAFAIEKKLETGVDAYLEAIGSRYPSVIGNEDLKNLLEGSFAEIILETQDIVDQDVGQIGQALHLFDMATKSPNVQSEIKNLRDAGDIQDRLIGLSLRLWAREFPGADIGYTVGRI